jgi:hypothetical protein
MHLCKSPLDSNDLPSNSIFRFKGKVVKINRIRRSVWGAFTPILYRGMISLNFDFSVLYVPYYSVLLFSLPVCNWWPPLWYSGQNSWLQIRRFGFDSQRYQIFWEVVGLERGSLSLVSTIKELLEIKSSGSVIESLEYGSRDQLALTSPTSGGCSVGIVRSRTQATELVSL